MISRLNNLTPAFRRWLVIAGLVNAVLQTFPTLGSDLGGFDAASHQPSIDWFIDQQLDTLRIEPSPPCSDVEFLRRITLDLCGRLPEPEEVLHFVEDEHADRRERLIDWLLTSDEYALRWSSWLCELSGCLPQHDYPIGRAAQDLGVSKQTFTTLWREWLRTRVAADVPYNQIVADMLLATTREGKSRQEYLKWDQEFRRRLAESPSAAAEFYGLRKTCDAFWRTFLPERSREHMPIMVANSLMGIQLECARCHNHPFDRWTEQDYQGFEAFFQRLYYTTAPPLHLADKRDVVRQSGLAASGLLGLLMAGTIVFAWRGWHKTARLLLMLNAVAIAAAAYVALGFVHLISSTPMWPTSPGVWLANALVPETDGQDMLIAAIVGGGALLAVMFAVAVWSSRHRSSLTRQVLAVVAVVVLVLSGATAADALNASQQPATRLREPLVNIWRRRLAEQQGEQQPVLREVHLATHYEGDHHELRLFDGQPADDLLGDDPRQVFWEWLEHSDYDYLSRNLVNRVWAEYFGIGLVEPVDDLSTRNVPSHPALFDWLAADFRAHGSSLRRLHRQIVSSRAYQRSSGTRDSAAVVKPNYACFQPRRLSGRQLIAAIDAVTGTPCDFGSEETHGISAWQFLGQHPGSAEGGARAIRLFCGDGAEAAPSVPEAMYLLVEPTLNERIAASAGRLRQTLGSGRSHREILRGYFLSCFARQPTTAEEQHLLTYIENAGDTHAAWCDIVWMLINSPEFQYIY
jgi:hypothetical protein